MSGINSIDDLKNGPATIVYDGDCPFCSSYVSLLHLRESVGQVRLLNARKLPRELLSMLAENYNLDRGMLFGWRGKLYYGGDAINRLALLSSDSGRLRKFSAWALSKPAVSESLYPLLRLGRNAALTLRGKGQIHG